MDVEVKSKRQNKNLYKIELKLIKILPSLLAFFYFINGLFSLFGIDLPILSYIAGVSFIPLIFMYISSYVFQFCSYHRMFLHYIVISNVLSIIDYHIGIPISTLWFITLYVVLFCVFLFVILYLYLKSRRDEKNNCKTVRKNTG